MNSKKDTRAMAALLAEDQTPPPPKPGEPVTGKIVSISGNRIIVEIDGIYTGIIAGREAADGFGTAKNAMVGDDISSYVVEDENPEGYYILSLRKASREKAWVKLGEMKSSGEAVEITIREANKGGLMTDFNGIRAFIPVSQLAPEHYPRVNGANSSEILSKLKKFVGEKFTVLVLTAEPDENKLIFSEKAGLSKKREAALRKLKVGDKIKGKVTGIVNFGIFIMFNNCLEGLVHLSEVAWGKVTDATSYARVGEECEAIVIGVEPDKISLSMKRLTTDPWLKNVEKFAEGDVIASEVERVAPLGVIVKLDKNISGIIPIAKFGKNAESEPNVDLEVGDKLKVTIGKINTDDHRIELSRESVTVEEK